jgi:SAM-dependent methyltransferase
VDRVQAILLEETLAATGEIAGLLAEPAPYVLFNPGPGDSALGFQVNYSVSGFAGQYLAQSELRKRLYKRLQGEKITMPFPTRTVLLEQKTGSAGTGTTPYPTDPILTAALEGLQPGNALDLAAGAGRHAKWLAERGWNVTAVDRKNEPISGVHYIGADLENHEYRVEPDAWDLIVCWLYWQPDLLPEIAAGVKTGGVVALAGKTDGRFATSLANFRAAFPGWTEIASGENETRAFLIARKELID